jgi:imidazole glycerol phosphate synthase glutamine amidotransferase subunit
MIAILDYGAGNLRSVENTLAEIGADYELVRDADVLRNARKIILPGVGHFGQMMRALDEMQVRVALTERIRAGVPFLGICLGLQALFEWSEEAPEARGLGLYEGAVRRFPAGVRLPHMGWNQIETRPDSRLLAGVESESFVIFMHSYYVPEVPAAAATCTYGVRYTAALESGNTFAVQFHPEKSGRAGLRVVRNFVELR